MQAPRLISLNKQENRPPAEVSDTVDSYLQFYDERKGSKLSERRKNAVEVVTKFYNVVTDFYEYGWGQSFHFFPVKKGETFNEGQTTHQHRMALKGKIGTGMRVLDAGCGIGGPGREIASLAEAKVTGLNISSYQIQRARAITKKEGLEHLCDYVEGSYTDIPFEDNTFDRVFTIESICHAGDKRQVFSEIYRVLKPGGLYVSHYWALTDKYDETNAEHKEAIKFIVEGNALPELQYMSTIQQLVRNSGLTLVEAGDFNDLSQTPWSVYLQSPGTFSVQNFRSSWLGRTITHTLLSLLETIHVAPKGSVRSHQVLLTAATGLVRSQQLGIFTPMGFFVAKKPEE
ncbi:uncharacterized protein LOC134182813 [Corticium candelabrum]|uniref:uncharacterized protein LOC134182813 n=1 Tax=Corticium candelabrum TaxID=121492 RepID=UPI002E269562|nr:uncharacterized protein LOC134182813 [Corticium candelabrum]